MNKYKVIMIQTFYVKAKDESEAEDKAIEICADDSEVLMPHNMNVQVEVSEAEDSYFND